MIEQLPIGGMGLGAPVREFTVGRGKLIGLTIVGLAFAASGALFVIGLLFFVQAPPGDQEMAIVFDAVFGLPVAVLVGSLARRVRLAYGLRALVYSGGMALRRGGKTTIIRWEHAESVRVVTRQPVSPLAHLALFHFALPLLLLRRLQPERKYTVRLRDGTAVKIPPLLTHADELGVIVERETARVLLPGALAACAIGTTVAFGAFSAGRDGLRKEDKLPLRKGTQSLPWGDFEDMELRDGKLHIYKIGRRRWAAVATDKVPNLYLLGLLADDIHARAYVAMAQ